jgi:hypothetical protein
MEKDTIPRGMEILYNPRLNKGTAFTERERDALGLRGLLPPRVHTQDEQVDRVVGNIRKKPTDIERYIFLVALQVRNEKLFYRVVTEHIEEMMRARNTRTFFADPRGCSFPRPIADVLPRCCATGRILVCA